MSVSERDLVTQKTIRSGGSRVSGESKRSVSLTKNQEEFLAIGRKPACTWGWFSAVGRIKEKAIGSYGENRRHPDKAALIGRSDFNEENRTASQKKEFPEASKVIQANRCVRAGHASMERQTTQPLHLGSDGITSKAVQMWCYLLAVPAVSSLL